MLGKIKDAIQGRLYRKCIEEYERELRCQTEPYLAWVKETEQGSLATAKNAVGVVYLEKCGRTFSPRSAQAGLHFVCVGGGQACRRGSR